MKHLKKLKPKQYNCIMKYHVHTPCCTLFGAHCKWATMKKVRVLHGLKQDYYQNDYLIVFKKI